jgi:hypothetical protein
MLKFIEDELNVKNLMEVEGSTVSSSSSEESKKIKDQSFNSPSPTKLIKSLHGEVKPIMKKDIHKKFFNIELKLRAYLKEQSIDPLFNKHNFDSFLNDSSKLSSAKTPLSKMAHIKTCSPIIIKCFFEDKQNVLDKAKKRYSVMENFNNFEFKSITNSTYKCRSNLDKLNDNHDNSSINSISKFNPEFSINNSISSNNNEQILEKKINLPKRNSIFKEGFKFNEFKVIPENDNNYNSQKSDNE